jgi:hypothetical protein
MTNVTQTASTPATGLTACELRKLHILQHSVGINEYGEGTRYRNHFVTSPGSKDFDDCRALVVKGFMVERPGNALSGGPDAFIFSVTTEGGAFMDAHARVRKPLTRGQQRYQSWVKADCGLTFGQWLTSPHLS